MCNVGEAPGTCLGTLGLTYFEPNQLTIIIVNLRL